MNTLNKIQTIIDTLKDLDIVAQKPFRDSLMVASENEWSDILNLADRLDSSIVDIENDDYVWYREDDLKDSGYIHESDLECAIRDDLEMTRKALLKDGQVVIPLDALGVLYTIGKRGLSDEHLELCEAILEDEGLI